MSITRPRHAIINATPDPTFDAVGAVNALSDAVDDDPDADDEDE